MNKLMMVLFLSALVLLGCRSARTDALPAADTEVYAVYSSVINHNHRGYYLDRGFLIVDQTLTYDEGAGQTATMIVDKLPDVWPINIDEWEQSNIQSHSLVDQFALTRTYSLVSSDAIERVFDSSPKGWDMFAQTFPNTIGYIELSNVTFTPDKVQAMVYMSTVCGGTCGTGDLYLLSKTTGQWQVQDVIELWVS